MLNILLLNTQCSWSILSFDKLNGKHNLTNGTTCRMEFITKRMGLPGTKHPTMTCPAVRPDGHTLIEADNPICREHTALRSTPELASPSVKISFLFKGFLLLFPIRDLIDAKKFDANFHQLLLLPSVFWTPKSGNWRRRTRFWRQNEDQE
jgi:hypothetical protein